MSGAPHAFAPGPPRSRDPFLYAPLTTPPPARAHTLHCAFAEWQIVRYAGQRFAPAVLLGGGGPAQTAAAAKWMDWTLSREAGGGFSMKARTDRGPALPAVWKTLFRDPILNF